MPWRRDRLPTYPWASLVAQLVKNPPAMWETWVGKIPCRKERLSTPVFWPGEYHGAVHGVPKSQTRLSDFHFHTHEFKCIMYSDVHGIFIFNVHQ